MANEVDLMKMLDIQSWVDLVYVSSVYKSICDNSDSNVSTVTTFYTPNPSLRRSPTTTTDWLYFLVKLLETLPSPRGENLVISDCSLKWLLIGCWLFSLFWSNQIVSIIPVALFFTPGYRFWSYLTVGFVNFWLDRGGLIMFWSNQIFFIILGVSFF